MTKDLTLKSRHLYRALLRELPRRPLSSPSPLKQRFRERFQQSPPPPSTTSSSESSSLRQQIEKAEQFIRYARAQRMYATLLERYNPGMGMDQEERVRLTARRVGMDLPVEVGDGKGQ
ncbi:hypothetical protein BGW36DRAFT_357187 [Talaromyces proteolyticus]|uniref:Uncharacterized protein n=1 Tax=Talaromyces proteolyticus TaxID=1131652 RepID=A0AAD4KYR1_9EURO|nr:uncharacterized protein BGW36DRAFT_357187 [Talaromyces proteolyticus]KAH8700526.1 hypothetical protein BGW36DRAFT_357187 [Talaromyces proteolyticus]